MAAAECDDELMEALLLADLQSEDISGSDLEAALRRITLETRHRAVLSGDAAATVHSAVVTCGASLRNIGVQPVLDAVVSYLPGPFDIPPFIGRSTGLSPPNELDAPAVEPVDAPKPPAQHSAKDSAQLVALAFKVVHDRRRGPIVFVRVYSGAIRVRSVVQSVAADADGHLTRTKERIGKLLSVYANTMTEVDEVEAGNICAIVGLKHTRTGDTLVLMPGKGRKKGSLSAEAMVLPPIAAPEPVFCTALEADSNDELAQLHEALEFIVREDPSLAVSTDAQTAQLLLHGMGELHLEIIHDRLVRDYGLEGVSMSSVRIAYKEGVQHLAEANEEWTREIPSVGVIGSTVQVRVEPIETTVAGAEVSQRNILDMSALLSSVEAAGGSVSDEAKQAVVDGCADAWSCGTIQGYGLIGVKTTVVEADLVVSPVNTVDAIRAATAAAVTAAVGSEVASARLMEPVMALEIIVDESFVGTVLSDLSTRRGVVVSVGDNGRGAATVSSQQLVKSEVPLAELGTYSTVLRSLTAGSATFTMEFQRYDFCPE
jgi:elongation factor G